MPEVAELPLNREPLINGSVLRATFTNAKFLSHLVNLTHHAHLNLSEGGFVVQNIDGNPVVSDLRKSPRMRSINDWKKSYGTDPGVEEFDFVHITKNGPPVVVKPNVILEAHSHPVDPHDSSPESALTPSITDIESWEDYKLKTNNRHLIALIIVKKGNTGLVLIFQEDQSKPQSNDYQAWTPNDGRDKLFDLMRKSGIRVETLKLDIKKRKFPKEELDKLKPLAV